MPESRGGQAGAAGYGFQDRVAAWCMVVTLAESAFDPPWGLPNDTTFEEVSCETRQPTDDVNIITTAKGFVGLQVKRSPTLSRQPDSQFAEAIRQFVIQFVDGVTVDGSQRELERSKDRLVLVFN